MKYSSYYLGFVNVKSSQSHIRRRNRFDRLNNNAADEANRPALNPKEAQGDGEVEHITPIM